MAGDPQALVDRITELLEELGLPVHDGDVPRDLPTDGQYIRPYVRLSAGTGAGNGEIASCGDEDTDTNVFRFRLTAVAPSVPACRAVAWGVERKVLNAIVGTGRIHRDPQGFIVDEPLADDTVIPERFILPSDWRVITN